jgi:two-component system, NarL family, response regulator NreC
MIRILLVNDRRLIHEGMRLLLETQQDMTVIGSAQDVAEGEAFAARLHPDVVVVDLVEPAFASSDLAGRLSRLAPGARVIVVTSQPSDAAAVEALRSGASAFIGTDAPSEDLFRSVREAAAGRRFVAGSLSRSLIDDPTSWERRGAANVPYERLTAREREVLKLAAGGLSSAAIAERLFISPRTVETHRARLMRKLALHNQTELILFAVRMGLLRVSETAGAARQARSTDEEREPVGTT